MSQQSKENTSPILETDPKPQLDWKKVLVSVGILFHLLVMVSIPNMDSQIVRKLEPIILQYANLLGMNTTWRFFSPGPAPTMYLEYETLTASQEIDISTAEDRPNERPESLGGSRYRWPEVESSNMMFPNYRRLLYYMRYMIIDTNRLDPYFAPYICRKHPEAVQMNIMHYVEEVPNSERAVGLSFAKMARKRLIQQFSVSCEDYR